MNPSGFDKDRRYNENNIDLNRNLLTEKEFEEMSKRDPN